MTYKKKANLNQVEMEKISQRKAQIGNQQKVNSNQQLTQRLPIKETEIQRTMKTEKIIWKKS